MADEAEVRVSLQINKGNLKYQSGAQRTVFNADVSIAKGPSPGAITVTTGGTDVDLSELTQPGLCFIQNLDSTNFVEYGIWDGTTFFPLGELLAGEFSCFRISRNLTKEFGTGTGTTGAAINTLRLRADTASVNVSVEAFDT